MIEFKVTKRSNGKFKKDLSTKDFYKEKGYTIINSTQITGL